MTSHPLAISAVLAALDSANLPFALIGAAARNAWAPPRATTDLDLELLRRWAEVWDVESRLEAALAATSS